jgi:hypothetical protein
MTDRSFLEAYQRGEPVGVRLPSGGLYGIVGFVLHPDGISFMDDAFLDDMPTRHPNHHLSGSPVWDGSDLVLSDHRFQVLQGHDAERWRMMLVAWCAGHLRRRAEQRLRELGTRRW